MFMHQKPISFNSTFKRYILGCKWTLELKSNGIGKGQIALLVLLIPHQNTHCIYMYYPKIKLFSEFHYFLLYTN